MSKFARFLCAIRTALFAVLVCFCAIFNAVADTCASNEFEVDGNCVETKFTVTTTNMSAGGLDNK